MKTYRIWLLAIFLSGCLLAEERDMPSALPIAFADVRYSSVKALSIEDFARVNSSLPKFIQTLEGNGNMFVVVVPEKTNYKVLFVFPPNLREISVKTRNAILDFVSDQFYGGYRKKESSETSRESQK